MTEPRIIDRDIDFYDGLVDQHAADFAACLPEDEHGHISRRWAAEAVTQALREYRHILDGGKP